jgi:hypothetical protein
MKIEGTWGSLLELELIAVALRFNFSVLVEQNGAKWTHSSKKRQTYFLKEIFISWKNYHFSALLPIDNGIDRRLRFTGNIFELQGNSFICLSLKEHPVDPPDDPLQLSTTHFQNTWKSILNAVTSGETEALNDRCQTIWVHGLEPGTRSSYRSALKHFENWLMENKISSQDMARTIEKYIISSKRYAIVQPFKKILDMADQAEIVNWNRLESITKSLKRQRGKHKNELDFFQVKEILSLISTMAAFESKEGCVYPLTPNEWKLGRIYLILSFKFGSRTASELLRAENVSLKVVLGQAILINKNTKKNYGRKKCVPCSCQELPLLCPVEAVKELQNLKEQTLSIRKFNKILKIAVKTSFRNRGGATSKILRRSAAREAWEAENASSKPSALRKLALDQVREKLGHASGSNSYRSYLDTYRSS